MQPEVSGALPLHHSLLWMTPEFVYRRTTQPTSYIIGCYIHGSPCVPIIVYLGRCSTVVSVVPVAPVTFYAQNHALRRGPILPNSAIGRNVVITPCDCPYHITIATP